VKGCREGKGMRGRGRKERRGEKKRRKKRRGLKGVEGTPCVSLKIF